MARLDERASRHAVEDGFRERGHFFDAAAALWVAGELVHVEDLVLHDAHMDARAPTHELTIAHSILRARRRIWLAEPVWAEAAAMPTAAMKPAMRREYFMVGVLCWCRTGFLARPSNALLRTG